MSYNPAFPPSLPANPLNNSQMSINSHHQEGPKYSERMDSFYHPVTSTPSPSSHMFKGRPNNLLNNNASPMSSRNSSPDVCKPPSVPYFPLTSPSNASKLPHNAPGGFPTSGIAQPAAGPAVPNLHSSQPALNTFYSVNSPQQPMSLTPQQKPFTQSQGNISRPPITSQINNHTPMSSVSHPYANANSFPSTQYPPSKGVNQLPPTYLKNSNTSPAHLSTISQQSGFPNMQINSNAPPLIPSQAPSSQSFQSPVNAFVGPQIQQLPPSSIPSQTLNHYSNSQGEPSTKMPYSQGNVYNHTNILSSQTSLPNPSNYPPSQPKLPPRLPPYQSNPQSFPPSGPLNGPPSGPLNGPPSGPLNGPPLGPQNGPPSSSLNAPPSGPINGPPSGPLMNPTGLLSGPPLGPQAPFNAPQPWNQQSVPQYNNGQQELTQQMGKMSVTQNSFSQLWGQESVDLLQCRNVLPEDKVQPPTIKLNHQFSQSVNCSSDIFRCTLTKIPETNNLLQKSRLPLGVLIHPFKDLNHLPVIQCSTIVRCRACRTYINPFVYFIDLKRWKCNLCYRVNDLPEEFQYDPASKTYGEPRRRPEIQSATLEYVAPSEYMLRPPQPAAYTFLLDVSAAGIASGYLPLLCAALTRHLAELPGDTRTMLAFICYDHAVHYYSMSGSKPKQMTVIDIDDIFVPSPEDLLVNLMEKRTAIEELLEALPALHASPSPCATRSALGAALQAAHRLTAPTGGRITVFQTALTNTGPGSLTAREDPNNRSSKEVAHLNPATDFYKRLALDCSGVQVAVDLFLLNSQYADLSTLSGISQFSGGTVYHFPLFKGEKEWLAQDFQRCLTRYLTRKIGFEAVMRVRCTRGIAIHTFHGSFFVRSTDLLSLPNVSPDAGFGMQLTIEESLADVQHVCFQAALLYTSSKGERRIRVHTMCLPVVNTLTEVVHSADQQCIIGLLAKMGVDRSLTSSLSDAREALLNAAVDALAAQRITSGSTSGLVAPVSLRLMPLYLLALLKHPAFRTGMSTRLDDRVAAMCAMKSLPLPSLMRSVYPDLYPVAGLEHYLRPAPASATAEDAPPVPCPPRLHLSAEKVNATGAYLMDQETHMILYVGHRVDPRWLQAALGVSHHSLLADCPHSLPVLDTEENSLLHSFIHHLNDDRPYPASIQVILDSSPNRTLFTEKLLDDRVESALSYYEFLQHIKSLIK